MFPPTSDRVRQHTTPEVNRKIDEETERSVHEIARCDPTARAERSEELRGEWDAERVLEANAASLVVLGALLGLIKNRYFLLLPLVVGAFLLQHALQGWCPPLSLIRRLSFRIPDEISRERTALALLSGDLSATTDPGEAVRMARGVFPLSDS